MGDNEVINKFEETLALVKELDVKLSDLRKLISGMESDYKKVRSNREARLAGLDELEVVLMNCNRELCRYRQEFDEVRKKHRGELNHMTSRQDFHFFLCYRGDYYAKDGVDVIEAHKQVIKEKGFCWWGKFAKKRQPGGIWDELEPFGESIRVGDDANMAARLKANITGRLKAGKAVYVFNCDPNPPNQKLYVSKVLDFWLEKESIPPRGFDSDTLSCAFTPRYYFLEGKRGNCISCQNPGSSGCTMCFKCNFWFKIDKLYELENMSEEFSNLVNCFTEDTINFAIPILYPLLVTQKVEKPYFDRPEVPAFSSMDVFQIVISETEKPHSKEDQIRNFFQKLNKACGRVFGKVVQSKTFTGERAYLSSCAENNIIIVNLPAGFRRGGDAGIVFKVLLDENITALQKEEVERRIALNMALLLE